jgi:hypothetical protein
MLRLPVFFLQLYGGVKKRVNRPYLEVTALRSVFCVKAKHT